MASSPPKLTIEYSPVALRQLGQIWNYNSDQHSIKWADEYVAFIERQIQMLCSTPFIGKRVENAEEFRALIMTKRSRSDGHIAIYEVDLEAGIISITAIFHTKQNWQNRLGNSE